MSDQQTQKARIIAANYELQAKIGAGPLDEKLVHKAEQVLRNNQTDFKPMATDFLKDLLDGISTAQISDLDMKVRLDALRKPVMDLKANAAMFGYGLVSKLANVMLGFLEHIKTVDQDTVDIVAAHHKTLSLIVAREIKGDYGDGGDALLRELSDACKRYYTRKGIKIG